MNSNALRALADALIECGEDVWLMLLEPIQRAADYLRAQADAQPVAWLVTGGIAFHDESYSSREAAEAALIKRDDHARIKPLYTHPAPAAPQAEPKRDPFAPDELERIIDDYVADYELSDGEVSRDVSDEDRFMLKDAIMGLLVDPAWDRAWGALIDQRAREQAEPKREPLGGSNAE